VRIEFHPTARENLRPNMLARQPATGEPSESLPNPKACPITSAWFD
jgi:hypothetical protein